MTVYSTTLDGIFISLDALANGLAPIQSCNIHKSEALLLTLSYYKHKNKKVINLVAEKQQVGGCNTWIKIANDQDYLYPVITKRGLFVHRVGQIVNASL